MKQSILLLLALLAACALPVWGETASEKEILETERPEDPVERLVLTDTKLPRIFVVGDSTASPFADHADNLGYYLPRYGFGTQLYRYIDEKKAVVVNLAISGTSSRTFSSGSRYRYNYELFKNNIRKGDYLLIAFGHNDEKAGPGYSNPNTPLSDEGSFKYSLYHNFIEIAQKAGATPVLLTPIVRLDPKNAYAGDRVHVMKDKANAPGGDWAQCIRELAKELKVQLVDQMANTLSLYKSLGYEKAKLFHAMKTADEKTLDKTHLNQYGAARIAYMLVQALSKQDKRFAKFAVKGAKEPELELRAVNTAEFASAGTATAASGANASGTVYYIAPDGNDANAGTSIDKPFASLLAAQNVVKPGDTVYIRGGTYKIAKNQIMDDADKKYTLIYKLAKSGEKGKPISYIGYPSERPVFDFSGIDKTATGKRITAFYVAASYLYLCNFEIVGVQQVIDDSSNTQSEAFRIMEKSSYNTFENIAVHDGLACGWLLWSGHHNLVLNCDAYNNVDTVSQKADGGGGNVDGFGFHPNAMGQAGNMFVGCRAWWNSDDGFDLITAYSPVQILSSWAMQNGFADPQHTGKLTKYADGNGVKSGGYGRRDVQKVFKNDAQNVARHSVSNCIAWGNKSSGLYANHHIAGFDENGKGYGGIDFEFNTSAENGAGFKNAPIETEYNTTTASRFNFNLVSRRQLAEVDRKLTDPATGRSLIDYDGENYRLANNLGYGVASYQTGYFNPADTKKNALSGNTFQDTAHPLSADDFESTDAQLLFAPRAADGSLPDTSYLRLKNGSWWADKNVGFSYARYLEQVAAAKKASGCFAE